MPRRFWRARWLWIVFLAGGLVLVFLFRGGDLAMFWPNGDEVGADQGMAASTLPAAEIRTASAGARKVAEA